MNDFCERLSSLLPDIFQNQISISPLRGTLKQWKDKLEDFISFYYSLCDKKSKDLFFNLLRYNIGFSFSGSLIQDKYAIYNNDEWSRLVENAKNQKYGGVEYDYLLDRIEVYELKGYEYEDICIAKEGDYVFDCGAYTGNTGIYFSNLVKTNGRVFSFEAMPETFEKLLNNIKKCDNIYPYNFAIVNKSKTLKFTKNASAGSRIVQGGDYIEVKGISIDEFVRQNNIDRVDFIKMDIEGAELDALDGCSELFKKFSPKLAICIYHKPEDWVTIPQKILNFNKNYNFYLKHNSNNFLETVLFAIPGKYKKIDIDETELIISKNIFDGILNLHHQQNLKLRKDLLSQCVKKTKLIKNFVSQEYASNNIFVYFPISKDKRLHYELLFSGNTINISLHLEDKWKNFADIFKDIRYQLDVFSDIYFKQGFFTYGYELTYQYNNIYNTDIIAKLFDFLIEKTLPIIKANKLINSDIYFNL